MSLFVVFGDVVEINSATAIAIFDSKKRANDLVEKIKHSEEAKNVIRFAFYATVSRKLIFGDLSKFGKEVEQGKNEGSRVKNMSLWVVWGTKPKNDSFRAIAIFDSEQDANDCVENITHSKKPKDFRFVGYSRVKPNKIFVNFSEFGKKTEGEEDEKPWVKTAEYSCQIMIEGNKIICPDETDKIGQLMKLLDSK